MSSNSTMLKWVCIMAILVKSALSRYPQTEGESLYALRQSLSDPHTHLQTWDPTVFDACVFFYITCEDGHFSRIDLIGLNLSGPLVPDLANLVHLKYLNIQENNIQGSIPPELGNLENLLGLNLYNNQISGPIPKELGNLKSLIFMRLNHNQLAGPIPTELTTLNSLRVLDFSNNNLCGTIPRKGAFANIPLESFKNNPRLHGPQWLGVASNGANC